MLPHAGYMYSGRVAAETVSRIEIKEKIILLGPNHNAIGADFSIMSAGAWQTPLGNVKIDGQLAQALLQQCPHLKDDASAHAHEHSLEVELPFIQYMKSDFAIVPIAVLSADIKIMKQVGRDIADAIKKSGTEDKVLIVASSDMTHYESQEQAEKKDQEAIKAILDLDEDRLMERIERFNITMCGAAPMVIALVAAKHLGAKKAELVKYETSAEVTGDKTSVVGYAGIVII
jgi:hypothetical protein